MEGRMTPTNKLRFVERDHLYVIDPMGNKTSRTFRVLQQWFEYDVTYPTKKGEWRDVPIEKEAKND
jgi:hypothetical protein